MDFQMIEVTTPELIHRFLDLPEIIYKDDPNWIRPLDNDIEDVFNPNKNKRFHKGKCKRWLLIDQQSGRDLGRVATFVDKKYKQAQPTGGFGFFEVIEQQEAAFFIFDFCRDWLKEQGMVAMDGPINFGERNRFWGLVVEGYYSPIYAMNYNPPYYKDFFEAYGFKVYFYQECYGLDVAYSFSDKMKKRYGQIADNSALSVRHIEKKNWQKYARDFTKVYNEAWAQHGEGKTLNEQQAIKMFKSMKPVMDEYINWFVYEGEEPVAFWINLPDLNQWFKTFNGKFGLLQKLKFLWMKQFKSNERIIGIVFGVVPKWQGKGVDALMIIEGTKVILRKTSYKKYEMQWIGDFNPKMINVAKGLGAKLTRRLGTYRYLFDRTLPFERHPMV